MGAMSLLSLSNGIGYMQSSRRAYMVGMGFSRENPLVFVRSTTGEAREVGRVASCAYFREPIATIVQNRSCNC